MHLCCLLTFPEWAFCPPELHLPFPPLAWEHSSRTQSEATLHLCSLQVFRTDLITAMKIPDSYQLSPDDYYILADPWRQEWEKGVQVPAGAEAIPEPVVR